MQTAYARLITGGGSTRGRREEQTVGIWTSKQPLVMAAAFVLAVAAAGCVSEDEGTTEPTRDAAFLGYSNPETKQTTCGNCHVDVQAEWAQTKHAGAWATLQASGHAQAMCNKCHTVSGLTNGQADSAGFFAVSGDAQRFYQDVQCESCHGPGAAHVSAPGETQPLPTMLVPADYSDGCTACHNSSHHPFAEQLASSRHGQMPYWEHNSCQVQCHNGFGAMGVYAPAGRYTYKDGAQSLPNYATAPAQGLLCSTCHQPHNAEDNPAQLRMAGVNTTDSAQHVCGKCHNRGAVATASSWRSSRGAHSAQFATLMGYSGSTAGMGNIQGAARHGTMEGSCARCHVPSTTVTDAAGAFAVQDVGHTFKVVPCRNTSVGTGGVDTTDACTEEQRDFSACATSDCHGSQESARLAMDRTQGEIRAYTYLLWTDLDHDDTIDAFPVDSGWLPRILAHDATRTAGSKRLATSGADTVYTVAKSARFNVLTFGHPIGHADGSWGVHNPGYVRAVMANTVSQVRATYAVSDTLVGVPPAVQALLARDLGAQRR